MLSVISVLHFRIAFRVSRQIRVDILVRPPRVRDSFRSCSKARI